MEFDHVKGNKKFEIGSIHKSSLSDNEMIEALKVELEKCEVCCSNCHQIRTSNRYKNSKRLIWLKKANVNLFNQKEIYVYSLLGKSQCLDCNENNLLVLDFDHVSGAKRQSLSKMMKDIDFTLDNVKREIEKCEIRCKNCHRKVTILRSQGKLKTEQTTVKEQAKDLICVCGNPKKKETKTCSVCRIKNNRKIDYPPTEELIFQISTKGWEATARYLGVSSNAIRKFLRKHNINIVNIKKNS